MTFSYLFILALVQGLTEFLPVSSSAHLVLLPHVMGHVDQGQTIDIALHFGTLLAILVYYHKDFWMMFMACVKWRAPEYILHRRRVYMIMLATIPAVIAGFAIHHFFPEGIRSVRLIAINMIVFGIIMGVVDLKCIRSKTIDDMSFKMAGMMGLAQAAALIPGVSRSGMTITMGRFLGLQRGDAARFSFLLGTPAMAGAALLDFKDAFVQPSAPGMLVDMAGAIGLSFVFGLAAIHFMIRWLQRFGLFPFTVYRVILGVLILVMGVS